MNRLIAPLIAVSIVTLGGCSGLPPFDPLGPSGPKVAPAAPKVAALVANLKCEMEDIATSDIDLPYYEDAPVLGTHQQNKARIEEDRTKSREDSLINPSDDRKFRLKNILQEVKYVADVQLTLDVTGSDSFSPSYTHSHPYQAAAGLFPATGYVLSVNGQISDAGHRYIQIYTSVDMDRLVPERGKENNIKTPCSNPDNRQGTDLGGHLGLAETLATALIADAMSDIHALPNNGYSAVTVQNSSAYSFGEVSTQVDFTVVEGLNGGPTWTLKTDKFGAPAGGGSGGGSSGSGSGGGSGGGGSGGGSSGLVGFNRQVKDTINITFIPVCLRHPFINDHGKISPTPVVGSPVWVNYLENCNDTGTTGWFEQLSKALSAARQTNNVNTSSLRAVISP